MRILAAALLICCCPLMMKAQEKHTAPNLSPLTKRYLRNLEKHPQELYGGYIYNKAADGKIYISAIIKINNAAVAQAGLEGINAQIGTKAGRIWTVKVPVERVKEFTQLPGIRYIQLDEPAQPHLDVARKTTRADSAQAGYGLPMGYSGDGVVMGVIDFGFDYNHPSFYDTFGTAYRVKRVWEMNRSTGTPPAGYTYGRELTDSNAIRAAGTDDPKQNHGSSTTGMAAGSGYGSATSGRKYRGMAYQSDIVWVGVRRDSIGGQWMQGGFSDFIDGVKYIFDYANSVSKPAVVNISWGSQSGSHDGTSLMNEACDSMSGPGKIIVMSAGNEGEEKIHLSKTFTPTDTVIKTYLTFDPATYKRTWVDIWGQPGKTWCAQTTLFTGSTAGSTTGYLCIDGGVMDTFIVAANGTDTCWVEYITSPAEDNGKPRMTINIWNKSTDTVGISVKSTSGSIDMWDEYYYYGFPYKFQSAFDSLGDATARTGNTVSTVSDMGSAQSVLLVGAYASKVGFTDMNGNNWSYAGYVSANRLAPFSSRGPMIDGRIKPDICAPGLTIATSMSSYDTSYTPTGTHSSNVVSKYTFGGKDYYYSEFTGTSASAPAASGIVAMLLQANPTLTPDSVKYYLFSTAIVDAFTGAIPASGNNNWGHGKINAYRALKSLLHNTGTYSFSGRKLDCLLFPNPNSGSFSLDYTGAVAERLSVTVRSLTGQLVYERSLEASAGFNRFAIDLAGVAKGNYVVNVVGDGGNVAIKTVVQ